MTLIKSISGIRGTIGGASGNNLTPLEIVKFTAAFAHIMKRSSGSDFVVVVGRDARISGEMVSNLVNSTLVAMGATVIDLGLSTTPTVEMAVPAEKACAGIIITASHNPAQWNALKLLNSDGEFISGVAGEQVLKVAEEMNFAFADVKELGKVVSKNYMDFHIQKILELPLVNRKAISACNFSIAVDAVNSSGGVFIPELLKRLGVNNVHCIHCNPDGNFAHNPEPLAAHLTDISNFVVKNNCDLGVVVDPDVDRLALVCQDGSMFGEEYTLVAVADYVLRHTPGNTVSNLSSTRALRDVTEKHGQNYSASAVGEVNVVSMMKSTKAIIGGEGNGGVIYPELHYGRDALAGTALFLSALAESKLKATEFRDSFPQYVMSKNKIELPEGLDIDAVLSSIPAHFPEAIVNLVDGVKLDLPEAWIHLRKSNTEPIIRIYVESKDSQSADLLVNKAMDTIRQLMKSTA